MSHLYSAGKGQRFFRVLACLCLLTLSFAALGTLDQMSDSCRQAFAQDSDSAAKIGSGSVPAAPAQSGTAGVDARLERMEKQLASIRETGEKAEARSYQNKMMSRELIRYVRVMVLVLVAIALGFPLTILILSRKRLMGVSGLSPEVAETLLSIEERQAKLANLVRDIQAEMEFLSTQASPDLKNLVRQAESYLKQSERDMESTGLPRSGRRPEQT